MVRMRSLVLLLGMPLAAHLAAGHCPDAARAQAAASERTGLVVESVDQGSAAADAGLRPGDLLIAWERTEAVTPARPVASGRFRTPFDARDFEIEQLPRGNTRLIVERAGTRVVLPLLPGAWDLIARPLLKEPVLQAYAAGLAAATAGDAAAAMTALQPIVDGLATGGRSDDAAWLLARAGGALLGAGKLQEAEPAFTAAIEHARRSAKPDVEAHVLETRAEEAGVYCSWVENTPQSLQSCRPFAEAYVESCGTALKLRREAAAGPLAVAADEFALSWRRWMGASSWPDAFSALSARAQLAPGSFDHALSLWVVGLRLSGELRSKSSLPVSLTLPGSTSPPTREDVAAMLERARDILERVAPNHIVTALVLGFRGRDKLLVQENVAAAEYLGRAVKILDAFSAPRAFRREAGLFHESLTSTKNAFRIEQDPLPTVVGNLGTALWRTGELDEAEAATRRALALRPENSTQMANLASVMLARGDVAGAEALHYQLLSKAKPLEVGGSAYLLSHALGNLGQDAYMRGDLKTAAAMYEQALAQAEADAKSARDYFYTSNMQVTGRAPANNESFLRETNQDVHRCRRNVPTFLLWLSDVAQATGDFAAADRFADRAMSLDEECSKFAFNMDGAVADPKGEFRLRRGRIAEARGDFSAAETFYSTALERARQTAPGVVPEALQALGDARRAAGKPAEARTVLEEALALRSQRAPGSRWHAETLHSLGLAQRDLGLDAEADRSLRAAIDTLDSQRARLGGTGLARVEFAARVAPYYHDYLEFLLDHGRRADAFAVLERARARTMIEMLAERRVAFAADIPAPLARERNRLAAEYDALQDRILALDPVKNGPQVELEVRKLYQLQAKLDATSARIQQVSPRAASIEYPQPLALAGTRSMLDPGTVLLSYAVGRDRTFLFVVSTAGPPAAGTAPRQPVKPGTADGLSVFAIAAGEKDLRQRIEAFRRLHDWQMAGRDDPAMRMARSRELYDLLVRPAESLIAPARRVVLSPDGPLGLLPFAALVRGGTADRPEYVVEWKPLHTTLSATVYGSLKARRQAAARAPRTLVAFGDPVYTAVPAGGTPVRRDAATDGSTVAQDALHASDLDPDVQFLVRGGLSLAALPASRREVEAIGGLFAPSAAVYVGEDATEERAKSVGPKARILHFAVHGVLSPRFPLNSGLALTMPQKRQAGADNGLLQAWEVFERMRLDADLVTLSACESALGAEIRGEGLFGLTRAFEYAGARSVLASLWKVDDDAALALMTRFYTNLKAGQPKDEALRSAQLALIRGSETGVPARLSLPVHWAAFQLDGDWR